MNSIILEILYLTHDKWKDRTEVKGRESLKNYLIDFLELEPKAEEDLKMIVEYGQEDDKLVIQIGVIQILKKAYPITHSRVTKRQHISKVKQDE